MRLIRSIGELPLADGGCVATIGNFDGVHRGHRAVIEKLAAAGQRLGLPVCAILFEPQPREYFDPGTAPPRLMRLREKLWRLSELPIDQVLLLRFNSRLAGLAAESFITHILIEGLKIKYLAVGDDFRFGAKRRGDFALLKAFGDRAGFEVSDTPSVRADGERISSTLIREALAAGDLDRAFRLLGRPYSVCGRIIHGERRGRTLGFPTANLLMQRRHTPVQGVFAVTVAEADGRVRPGVANVGVRPTVAGGCKILLETHLLDFSGDLYGRRVEVAFHHKLREERRFSGLPELRGQIERDVADARTFFAGLNPLPNIQP